MTRVRPIRRLASIGDLLIANHRRLFSLGLVHLHQQSLLPLRSFPLIIIKLLRIPSQMANPCLSPLLPPSPSSRDSSPARLTAGFSLSGDDTNTSSSLVLQRPNSEDVTITFTLSTTTPPPTPPPHTIFPHLTSSSSSISNHVQPTTTTPSSASTNNVMTLPFLRRTASTHSQHHPRSDIDNDNSPSPSPVSPNLSEYASSNNPSPASHTLSMNSNDGHETHTSSSSDAPSGRMVLGTGQQQQGQQQQQQQVQTSAGRGGCW